MSVTTERIQNLREARGVDCLIVFGTQAWSQAVCERLLQEHHIMVSSPSLWQEGQPRPVVASTLLHILDGEVRIPVWEEWIALHGPADLDARPGLTFSTLDQAINAALAGAGVVVVDEAMIVREIKSGALRRHGDQFMDGPNGYWFVETGLTPATSGNVAAFKKWLTEQLTLSANN
jgi:DNA-binding transcriptional LysR family regulator